MPKVKAPSQPKSWDDIYRAVEKIPKGKVATYGQIAFMTGNPRGARQVGYALAALDGLFPPACKTPWQRVINRFGEISYSTSRGGGDEAQKVILESEGIIFDAQGRIDLARFGWQGLAED